MTSPTKVYQVNDGEGNDGEAIYVSGQLVHDNSSGGLSVRTHEFKEFCQKTLNHGRKALFVDVDSSCNANDFINKFISLSFTPLDRKSKKFEYTYFDEQTKKEEKGQYHLFKFKNAQNQFVYGIKAENIGDNTLHTNKLMSFSKHLQERHLNNGKYNDIIFNCFAGFSRSVSLAINAALSLEVQKCEKLTEERAKKIIQEVANTRYEHIKETARIKEIEGRLKLVNTKNTESIVANIGNPLNQSLIKTVIEKAIIKEELEKGYRKFILNENNDDSNNTGKRQFIELAKQNPIIMDGLNKNYFLKSVHGLYHQSNPEERKMITENLSSDQPLNRIFTSRRLERILEMETEEQVARLYEKIKKTLGKEARKSTSTKHIL